MPEISALLRQEVNKFKVSLGYIVRLHAKSNQIKTTTTNPVMLSSLLP